MAASKVEPGATGEARVELSVELTLPGPGQSLVAWSLARSGKGKSNMNLALSPFALVQAANIVFPSLGA